MLCSLLAIASVAGCAPADPEPLLQPAELRHDLLVLRTTLEEAHPGLYWYTDSQQTSRSFDSINGLLHEPMTYHAFFRLLLPAVAQVRCVHTRLLPRETASKAPQPFSRLLPVGVFAAKGKLYYSADKRTRHVVHSINGLSSDSLLRVLLASLPADGFNETYKYHLLNSGALWEGYALFFGQPPSFRLHLVQPSGVGTTTRDLSPASPSEVFHYKKSVTPLPLQLKFVPAISTAVLTVNSFEMAPLRFRDSLQSLFTLVTESGARHLVIDLQQNGGGRNDNVSALYAFIARERFLHLERAERNNRGYTYQRYFEQGSVRRQLPGTAGGPTVSVAGQYAGSSYAEPSNVGRFGGEVMVLISGQTLSAASEFAALVRSHGRALLIGEETGGCYYRATGGEYIRLVLPASRLRVTIPTISIQLAVKKDLKAQPVGRGTFPDIVADAHPLSELPHSNGALDRALKYIREGIRREDAKAERNTKL